ncbi:hypothetical protein P168DRAFT_307958, partial [Aspergillus campestris IBT 28561]
MATSRRTQALPRRLLPPSWSGSPSRARYRQLVNPGARPEPANWRVLEPEPEPSTGPAHRALPTGKFWSPTPSRPESRQLASSSPAWEPSRVPADAQLPSPTGDPWTRANWRVPDPANWPGRVIGVLFRSFTSVLLRRFHLWTPPPTTRGPRSPVNWPAPRPEPEPGAGAAWPWPRPRGGPHRRGNCGLCPGRPRACPSHRRQLAGHAPRK